jgi:LysR family transcriptional regulator for metE and metH
VLTAVGEKYYKTATKILRELGEAEAEVKKMVSGEKGVIRISTECYTNYHWLPAVLRKFEQEFPAVEVEIVFEATLKPVEKLIAGELDLAITSNPEPFQQLEYVKLFTDEMLVVVSSRHPWASRKFVDPEAFKHATLIIHSLPLETVSLFRERLIPRGISPKKLIVLPLTEASIELVKADMGVMVLANWALKPYLNDGISAIKIGNEGFFRQQYVARIQDRDYPVYYERFVNFLREEITSKYR